MADQDLGFNLYSYDFHRPAVYGVMELVGREILACQGNTDLGYFLQEELRDKIVSIVKQSAALNRPGVENLKPRQLSDFIYDEIR